MTRGLVPAAGGSGDRVIDRRTFIAAMAGSLLAAPVAAEAQQAGKVYRVGLLESGARPTIPTGQGPLLYERLRELGWVYGPDLLAEQREYGDRIERVPDLAVELIRTGVDIFVVEGASEARRVQQATRSIPIVTLRAGDLVEAGLAASLARPGGNVTGIQTLQPELAAKHLSLLKEAIPRLSRSGILFERFGSSRGPAGSGEAVLRAAESSGKRLGIALQIVTIRGGQELEGAFSAFQAERAQAVVVVRSQFLSTHLETLVNLALKHRLPAISDPPIFSRQGGLMAYGYDFRDTVRSAADIVDKNLRGAKASEIPIQQATTFRLTINLKTAKALGLTIPQSLLLRADQVIE
jgi:putative tryptophan/tyrosine transport system substrate-binding protein